jgi:hypothetical protein
LRTSGHDEFFEVVSLFTRKTEIVVPDQALPGRETSMSGLGPLIALETTITPPFPGHPADDLRYALLLGRR